MDHNQLMLHELLQQDQEPFHLKTYISDKRFRLNSPTSTHRSSCFFSITNSPDVRKPPFIDFLSPAVGSPCGGAFLHVPARTAAVLVEAAMRIQNQSKPRPQILNVGINLFGSFMKILKHRSKSRVLIDCDLKQNEYAIRASCSCNRICVDNSGASTEIFHEIGDFESQQAPSCFGPFNFFLHKNPSSSFRRPPELFSPATSPIRRVNQEKCERGEEAHNVKGEEEKQEQCSPVSVLDSFLEDEIVVDLARSYAYAKIQRARVKLMERLRRFEKLASVEPLEVDEEYEEDEVRKEEGLDTSCLEQSVVEMVVKSELDEWKRWSDEETVTEIEVAILGRLMEEFSDEVFL